MGLPRGLALDLGKRDVFRAAHQLLPQACGWTEHRLLVTFETDIVADGTDVNPSQARSARPRPLPALPPGHPGGGGESALSRTYKERYGLGVPEWRVLAHLGQYAPITAKAIGAHSRMHKTKISRAVARWKSWASWPVAATTQIAAKNGFRSPPRARRPMTTLHPKRPISRGICWTTSRRPSGAHSNTSSIAFWRSWERDASGPR